MKKFNLLFFLILSTNIVAQEQSWYPGEMYLATANVNPPSQELIFSIEAQSTVWAGSNSPRSYWISTDYNISNFIPHANNEWPPQSWRGWDFVTDITNNPPYPIPIYAYGLYKITTNHSDEFFYLDFRDDRYGYYLSPINGHWIDLWIKYDAFTQEFSYSSSGSAYQDFIAMSKAEYLPIWEMKEKGNPHTSLFPNFWENCLTLIPDIDNHPMLVWGSYPDDNFSVQYYKIYKKKGSSNFTVAHTTSYLNWIDTSEIMIFGAPQSNEGICYYKITAVGVQRETSVETGVTNTVDTRVQGSNQEKLSSDILESESKKFVLVQNYPNPFNPSTKIEYSIAENSFVSLKVYDILGNEVAELVNEYKSMGEYQIEFNAAELPSGIYFYTLVSGNYISTKKLILLK